MSEQWKYLDVDLDRNLRRQGLGCDHFSGKTVKEAKCICGSFKFSCEGLISVGPEADWLLQFIDPIISNKDTELQEVGSGIFEWMLD